ncbi:nuclear pore complex protein Nup50-like [Clytia hemisphaerica]|uniref:RanBD1 domain-containing protein n=1 Tax=Clytia hemisphaerica TaxID=252671 RepID=A0A7M5V6K0_9CNID|eukprot:TCONS_00072110-protein
MATKKKRAADNYLTHDNWDQEDDSEEPEDPGVFKPADEEVLAQRTIRKAKRRGLSSASSGEEKSNPFAKFGGFGGGNTSTPTLTFGAAKVITPAKPVAPLAAMNTNKSTQNNFWGNKTEDQKKDFFSNRKPANEKPLNESATSDTNNNSDKENGSNKKTDENFQKELCQLNMSVLRFIQKNLDDNPVIDLQPVFNDYKKHIEVLNAKYELEASSTESDASTKTESKPEPTQASFKTPLTSKTPESALASAPAVSSAAPPFSFKSSTPIPANPFGELKTNSVFNAAASPFSFKPSAASSATTTGGTSTKVPETVKEENADDEDKVPEPERKTVVESDAFHTTRCKLFFKKGAEWKELGIGMLYLKPGSDDTKVQLLVRMETSTGKVLINVTVTNDTPTSRSGKNNVMVVTIPNPPVFSKPEEGDNGKPCTYLIRVKGTTEADELFGKIKK